MQGQKEREKGKEAREQGDCGKQQLMGKGCVCVLGVMWVLVVDSARRRSGLSRLGRVFLVGFVFFGCEVTRRRAGGGGGGRRGSSQAPAARGGSVRVRVRARW